MDQRKRRILAKSGKVTKGTKAAAAVPRRRLSSNEIDMTIKINQIVSDSLAPILEKLSDLQRASSSGSNTENIETGSSLTNNQNSGGAKSVYVVPAPTKPCFGGRGVHPVMFVEELEKYFKRMNYTWDDVDAVVDCLKSDAKNWAKIYRTRWVNFTDFKRDFLEQYWGRDAQNKVRRKIGAGRWELGGAKTMSEYFAELYCEAEKLNCYSSEKAVVDDIIQHFPQDIRRLWVISGYEGAVAASRFLSSIEGASDEATRNRRLQNVGEFQRARRPFVREDRNRNVGIANMEAVRKDYQGSFRPSSLPRCMEGVIDVEEGSAPEANAGNLNPLN